VVDATGPIPKVRREGAISRDRIDACLSTEEA
jgi:tRNA A37 threonylcarbamoyladenosine synthetase subunit TsaC/SUA5/YrdC